MEIGGTVTNVSDETFTRVNLHAFSSETPIRDSLTLSAVGHDRPHPVRRRPGDRARHLRHRSTSWRPGASATFTDSVPVELLATSGEPGVYWIGIHALGDSSVPRDLVADGRARTFIPRVPVRRRPATRGRR